MENVTPLVSSYHKTPHQLKDKMIMYDKVCLITDGLSSLGREVIRRMAATQARVVFINQDGKAAEAFKQSVIAELHNPKIDTYSCDLNSFKDIRQFCKVFSDTYPKLHVLINNVEVFGLGDRTTSKDGIESNFAVNHLAPFLLTNLLLPIIKKSQPARIINITSDFYETGFINFSDLEGKDSFNKHVAYEQSKLSNLLFTKFLAKKLGTTDITVNSFTPETDLSKMAKSKNPIFRTIGRLLGNNVKIGAETVQYLATSDEVKRVTGQYFEDKKIKFTTNMAGDMQVAKRLWNTSLAYVGLS